VNKLFYIEEAEKISSEAGKGVWFLGRYIDPWKVLFPTNKYKAVKMYRFLKN
jgi:hypothetical protein